MNEFPEIKLKIERRSSHPWIFQKMVEKPSRKPPNGSMVSIIDREDKWVGYGLYNGHSRIALRVLSTDMSEDMGRPFFERRISDAIRFRHETLNIMENTDAYRIIHSEGDQLSGLVVDRFGKLLVVEFFSSGMFKQRDLIFNVLRERFPGCNLYWFTQSNVQKQESFDCHPPEPPAPVVITENGMKFHVVAGTEHKTGFFVDQRENRERLSTLVKGKTVLDLCCNSGGFAVYAKAKGEASEVTAIDVDEKILVLAERNAKLNDARVRYVHSDIFNWLRVAITNKQTFETVILDPAKQTRSREEVDMALRRYTDMNRLAMQVIAPGGILLTCSCTGLVREDGFIDSVRKAAYQAGRVAQIFAVTGAGPDHPFLAHVDESRYLKAVWCRVL